MRPVRMSDRLNVDFEVAYILLHMASGLPWDEFVNQYNQDNEEALAALSLADHKPTTNTANKLNDSSEIPKVLQPNKVDNAENAIKGDISTKNHPIVQRMKSKKVPDVLRASRQKQEADVLETIRNHINNLNLPSRQSMQKDFLERITRSDPALDTRV